MRKDLKNRGGTRRCAGRAEDSTMGRRRRSLSPRSVILDDSRQAVHRNRDDGHYFKGLGRDIETCRRGWFLPVEDGSRRLQPGCEARRERRRSLRAACRFAGRARAPAGRDKAVRWRATDGQDRHAAPVTAASHSARRSRGSSAASRTAIRSGPSAPTESGVPSNVLDHCGQRERRQVARCCRPVNATRAHRRAGLQRRWPERASAGAGLGAFDDAVAKIVADHRLGSIREIASAEPCAKARQAASAGNRDRPVRARPSRRSHEARLRRTSNAMLMHSDAPYSLTRTAPNSRSIAAAKASDRYSPPDQMHAGDISSRPACARRRATPASSGSSRETPAGRRSAARRARHGVRHREGAGVGHGVPRQTRCHDAMLAKWSPVATMSAARPPWANKPHA